jgi:hypothetical protein
MKLKSILFTSLIVFAMPSISSALKVCIDLGHTGHSAFDRSNSGPVFTDSKRRKEERVKPLFFI